jgi:hypothetical protein
LDDYERLFAVKKEFEVFHEDIREAVLGDLAYRQVSFDCFDGVTRSVEIKAHPKLRSHYLVKYFRHYSDDSDVEAIAANERPLILASTLDTFYRAVCLSPTDVFAFDRSGLVGHHDVTRAFDELPFRLAPDIWAALSQLPTKTAE